MDRKGDTSAAVAVVMRVLYNMCNFFSTEQLYAPTEHTPLCVVPFLCSQKPETLFHMSARTETHHNEALDQHKPTSSCEYGFVCTFNFSTQFGL